MRISLFKKVLVVAIIILFIGMSINPSTGITIEKKSNHPISNGKTLYVGGTGEGNYTKIKDAIDNASDGDTVFVYAYSSPYYENVIVNKSINLIGENRDTTVIDGGGSGDVVYVSADGVNISGFTLRNIDYENEGIDIRSNYNTITGNTIVNNYDGIRLTASDNNIITGNIITSKNVCGIGLYHSDSNTIIGNNITNNFLGMFLRGRSNTITGNNISSNLIGGIWLNYACSRNTIEGNIITSNNHYGIELSPESPRNTITGNIISNNDDGIKVQYQSHRNIIKGNIISNNLCGINVSSSFNVILKNNLLNNKQHAFFSGSFEVKLKIDLSYGERRINFEPASRNHWLRNYWEGDNSQPVRINGMQSFYLTNSSYSIIWDFHIPLINFDWLPAKEPYDIGI